METISNFRTSLQNSKRSVHKMTRGLFAVAAVASPHGHTPEFGVGYFDGPIANYPYTSDFEAVHKLYSIAFVTLVCALLLASDVRVLAAGPVERGVATTAAGVVSVLLTALQMQGTYLAYGTWKSGAPVTGSGIWFGGALALYASIERA
jgi:hypothetical protein